MEDVGRHNAIAKIAGYTFLNDIELDGKLLYPTGRLTSGMVIKVVRRGIPILISRSGSTAWGVDLAHQANLTLIGRAKGSRFIALSGVARIERRRSRAAGPGVGRHSQDRAARLTAQSSPAPPRAGSAQHHAMLI